MKHFKIAGTSLKYLLAIGLLTACNHENLVNPTQGSATEVKDQNAKISLLTRLVKNGQQNIQYVKSGKFFGKVSRVNEAPWSGYYLTYAYDDSSPSGDLWIHRKMYKSSTDAFIKEERYKVVNGLCILSEDDYGSIHEYKYTPQGYLDEIKYNYQGNLLQSWKYAYTYSGSGQIYRLNKIERKKDGKPWINYNFTYKQIQDKYPLNNPLNIEDGNVDTYLPFFGNHSDLVIESITDENLETNKSVQTFYTGHVLNNDGLVISREKVKYATVSIEIFKYSDNWQGI